MRVEPERMLRGLITRFVGRSRTSEADRLVDAACAARAEGDLVQAEQLLGRAMSEAPLRVAPRCLLADIHLERGELEAAEAVLREAICIGPPDAQAYELLGQALRRRGDPLEASYALARALELDRKSQTTRSELAAALTDLGRPDEALPLLRWVLKRDPVLASAHVHCGIAFQELGRYDEALSCFEQAARIEPKRVGHLNHLAMCLRALDRHGDAVRALERARDLAPEDAATIANLAVVLRELGEPQAALAAVAPLVARRPDDIAARCALAAALRDSGDHAGARVQYDAALAVDPASGIARLGRAMLRLAQGDFAGGWDDYEGRLDTADTPQRGFPYSEWDGGALAGRSILVYAEQGLGDEIMFASCVPDLVAEAGRVVIECEPRLALLFQRSFPGAEVHGAPRTREHKWLDAVSGLDVQAAAGSLPRRYRRDAASFRTHAGYLRADPERVAKYRARLDALGPGRKIGIAWRGGLMRTCRAVRSVPPEILSPLLARSDLTFVSLQHGPVEPDLARISAIRGAPIPHWPEAAAEPEETAALMSALDAVVSVCSSVVHLAGALGVRTLVLVPASPEWRYLVAGERMPWYSSVTLVRQAQPGEWPDAVRSLASRL